MVADPVLGYRSPPCAPAERGRRLGRDLGDEVRAGLAIYRRLWQQGGGRGEAEIRRLGAAALERSARFAPELAEEMEGIAAGAALAPELVGAMNARTELLAGAAECSVAVAVRDDGSAVGVQTWDWHRELAGSWLVWTIERRDGATVQTLTEAGIVGKLGVSAAGVGVLLNILAHDDDGPERGVPVHVAARAVLDRAGGAEEGAALLAGLDCGASSAVTLLGRDGACTVELSPAGAARVEPAGGLLLHTNHFLAGPGRERDAGRRDAPDTLERLEALRRALGRAPRPLSPAALLRAYEEAGCGEGRVCCHPPAGAALGDGWQTLATVAVDPLAGTLAVERGGPCAGAAGRLAAAERPPARSQAAPSAGPAGPS